MSFAEIILRVGVAVGGWLIFIGNMLVVGVLRFADCTPGSEELWRGTLFLGLLGGAAVCASALGMKWQRELKVLAVIGGLLTLYASPVILAGFSNTTLGGESLCSVAGQIPPGTELSSFTPSSVERIWPVAQGVIGLIGLVQVARFFVVPAAPPEAD